MKEGRDVANLAALADENDKLRGQVRDWHMHDDIFVNRSGGKCSKQTFTKSWTRTDWWLDSDACIKLGFVDEVR